MRPFFLTLTSLVSFSLLAGCATGLSAEIRYPAYAVPAGPEILRVRVLYAKQPSRLGASGDYQVQLLKGGKGVVGADSVRVRAMHSTLVFGHQSYKGDVVVFPQKPTDTLSLNGRKYRGVLVFHALSGGRYDVVEYVKLEEYLYGVLPREVESSWPIEALKAQAVVSRTFALANKIADVQERFDVSDGVQDQVYGGLSVEAPESNHAVEDTRGQVLEDATGKPVQTFFHSSCGGHTEIPEHVWHSANAGDVFGCVADGFCDADPHYKWQLNVSYAVIRARLRKVGVRVSTIRKISIPQKSESGRAMVFGVHTSAGMIEVPSNKFRLALGPEVLRSTLIINMKAGKSSVWFEGRGWGHGVGLCQWGARGRALAGQTYEQILKTYYPKATFVKS